MLKIDNLTVRAQEKEILKDLDLFIDDGEIHVLMGPNGTGKSTICNSFGILIISHTVFNFLLNLKMSTLSLVFSLIAFLSISELLIPSTSIGFWLNKKIPFLLISVVDLLFKTS